MKKFILILFIGINLFAVIDTFNVSQITGSGVSGYRLWSDTLIWIRGADDSLLILTDGNTSFDITAWNYVSVWGIRGWDTTKTYYQTANREADFANLETWDSLCTVIDSTNTPEIKIDLSSITPARLARFLAIAQDSVTDTTGATVEFQLFGIENNLK